MSFGKSKIFLFVTTFCLFFLDLWTKDICVKLLGKVIHTAAFFINIEPSLNKGIGFGLLSFIGSSNQSLLIYLVISIIIFFSYISFKNYKKGFVILPEILVLTGGVGNLLSRIFYGGVVDFLVITLPFANVSVFNFADCYIFIGLFFLFCRFLDES